MKLLFSQAVFPVISLLAVAKADIAKEDEKFWNRYLIGESNLSIQPTLPPTGVGCIVDVTLECKLPDGRPCTDLAPPDMTNCAVGDDIDTVTFSFQPDICDPSANRQGVEASCVDNAAIDFIQLIDVVCVNAATGAPMDVSPSSVAPEGTFTVTNPEGGSLPDKISCELSQNGQIVQTNFIDTSGVVNLNLREKFGALQLESCTSEGTPELSCIETACYNLYIENTGTSDMDIFVLEFDFNGDVETFLDDLDVTTLTPGRSTSLEVKKDVDICIEIEYCAMVDVEANPPTNTICVDTDTYKFAPQENKLR